MTEIEKKYAALGGAGSFLGNPTEPEKTCPDGVGKYRHYQNGSIYWHPSTGAHEVHGAIRGKWAALGWEKSFLGYPKTDESPCPVGNGRYNLFQGGTVIWFPGAQAAFEVHGAIRNKWGQHGFESGFLGFPLTDETKTPDGIGRYNHFQNGSIYWKPSISAYEVHGLIRKYWADHGWEKNPNLGYPISDELPAKPGSKNRYSDFENGVLYWKEGSDHANELSKLTINNASRTAAEVLESINAILVPKLKANDRVYIKNGPFLAQVTDYSFEGTLHNRRHKVHVDLGIDISGVPDATTNLDIWIEIALDKASRTVNATLVNYHIHTHVPWPTSMGLSAKEVNQQFQAALDPMLWKPTPIATVPNGINMLSVKVMPNGDVNSYIEPGCFLTTACVDMQKLPDTCTELERLRHFRNAYMAQLPNGRHLLEEYNWLAPQLVEAIGNQPDKDDIYSYLYAIICQAAALIEQGNNEQALELYQQTMADLTTAYL